LGADVTEEIQTLWSLRDLDERLVILHAALRRFPAQREAVEKRLSGDRVHLEGLKKELADFRLKRGLIEKDIEALAAEERKFQGQLPLVKKNEEYTALLHEIAGAKKKRSDRETDLLVMMDEEEKRADRSRCSRRSWRRSRARRRRGPPHSPPRRRASGTRSRPSKPSARSWS
jgi:predicted  nucleic acid-binding Zn-ribbon protein